MASVLYSGARTLRPFFRSEPVGAAVDFSLDEWSLPSRLSAMNYAKLAKVGSWAGCAAVAALLFAQATAAPAAEGWVSLFNGKDLEGWTPKIKGHDLGDNFSNTFRVENGAICVRYEYKRFENRFGHLF